MLILGKILSRTSFDFFIPSRYRFAFSTSGCEGSHISLFYDKSNEISSL